MKTSKYPNDTLLPLDIGQRKCRLCEQLKPDNKYQRNGKLQGRVGLRAICNSCINKRFVDRDRPGFRAKTNARRALIPVPKLIVQEAMKTDRKHNRRCDVDIAFVEQLIADGCSYCGEKSIRMTIDRIDNSVGHMRNNVVAACARCNYARRDMPHEAWLVVAPGMRVAREAGLFGSWIGGRFKFATCG